MVKKITIETSGYAMECMVKVNITDRQPEFKTDIAVITYLQEA